MNNFKIALIITSICSVVIVFATINQNNITVSKDLVLDGITNSQVVTGMQEICKDKGWAIDRETSTSTVGLFYCLTGSHVISEREQLPEWAQKFPWNDSTFYEFRKSN